MSLSAKEAAEQVGLSKQAILKAINRGQLSATKDRKGEWRIDPAELFRVWEPVKSDAPVSDVLVGGTRDLPPTSEVDEVAQLATELAILRERLAGREALIAAKNETIANLRRSLDNAEARLLTDSKQQAIPWWRRLFGRK